MRVIIDRGDFWEFKARTSELELEAAKLRAKLMALQTQQHDLVSAFTTKHGLEPGKALTLEDADCSVSQG